jgi:hypothetical protein
MEESAQDRRLKRNLYEATRTLGSHFDDLGSKLKSSLDATTDGGFARRQRAREGAQVQSRGGQRQRSIKQLEAIDRVRACAVAGTDRRAPFDSNAPEAEEVERV